MKTKLTGHHVGGAAVLVTASLVTAACGSTPVTVTDAAAPKPLASGSWPYSNGCGSRGGTSERLDLMAIGVE